MPVFKCISCQRLLYRPVELLGRAWQCPICGPTYVSEEAVLVPAELAAQLEAEYQFSCSATPVVVTSPFNTKQVHLRKSLRIPQPGKRPKIVGAVIGLLLGILLIWVSQHFGKRGNRDLLMGWVCMVGSLGFVSIYLIIIGVAALYRRHVMKRVERHLSTVTASPNLSAIASHGAVPNPDQQVVLPDRALTPESKAAGEAHLQEDKCNDG